MRHSTLDIVVGDFGRSATLRYLETFSRVEEALISGTLPEGRGFHDAYRQVQITLLCHGSHSMGRLFSPHLREGRLLDESALQETSSRESMETILPAIASQVAMEATRALGAGHREVRVVLPSSSLGLIADTLGSALKGLLVDPVMDGPASVMGGFQDERASRGKVEPVSIQSMVARRLSREGCRGAYVLGGREVVESFAGALRSSRPLVPFAPASRQIQDAYLDCCRTYRRGASLEEGPAGTVRRFVAEAKREQLEVLETDADLWLGFGQDVVRTYALELVQDAYRSGYSPP